MSDDDKVRVTPWVLPGMYYVWTEDDGIVATFYRGAGGLSAHELALRFAETLG